MKRQMTEIELVESFSEALDNNHLYICLQPQINHATKLMVGAEALMRWKNPEFGIQFPGDFIPVLEKYDLIYRADLFVFEQVCKFQREQIDNHEVIVPISVNLSRHDIVHNDYVEQLENIRRKYDIPVKYLRIEITESSAIGGMELVRTVLDKLHGCGYLVEMDDFGSGYSSLNVLKDLEVDIIKLDMRFMQGEIGGRGGVIISSIVQMAKWLKTIIIAEGVETIEQADYMKSIGCNYIQGYVYSKPVPVEEFRELLKTTHHEPIKPAMKMIEEMDAGKFWNPDTLETLIFSNFVGGAAIFTYDSNTKYLDIIRINAKYLTELGLSESDEDIVHEDPWVIFGDDAKSNYLASVEKAIASNDEVVCETWRNINSKCCGENKVCIHTTMRKIGSADNQYLLYAMIKNITAEKRHMIELAESEKKFRTAGEHANIYAWEYTIATKEMRPCFRCMRDLGLPPVVENYPEPVIESGVFPADYADMYREMLHNIDEGCGTAEAIIPLTVGRIPFIVRYTTEFDDNGRPIKAYGSATLVVDNDEIGKE